MNTSKNITGIILAGGKSSRMGTDKGFLKLNGKLFIEHIIAVLTPFVSEIIIVSNHPEYDNFKVKRVPDFVENAGPLAGVYSGLLASKTENNLVLSCDIPLINSEILAELVRQIDDVSEIIQIESNGKTMPLISVYNKSCETVFSSLLNQGERRLRFAVNQCKVKNILLNKEQEKRVSNINTPEQLKEIRNEHIH
ncbi:MAG: molybdopterin-guanine dinucleotide biosynthesis protein A [Flavobacteriaceae bacterium]|jgi:molybdopterin-guanine dinucleotide biosynthesis protein A